MSRTAIHDDRTRGERIADGVAGAIGSWRFIIIQTVIVAAWCVLNSVALMDHWDPYPWILLNLLFSTQAAYTGPVLLLASNRQAAKDRAMAAKDDEEIGLLLDLQQAQMVHDRQTAKDLAAIARALRAEIGRG